ncbi:MAG: DMT family transporter [Actinomycetota bacterium]|nr:DMT family transporter [Actinomycetota bacterium]
MALTLALCSAFLYALGWVLQYTEAAADRAPPSLSPMLLGRLVRRPRWLAGIGAMVGGNVCQAVALSTGSLAVVEPALMASLPFGLGLGALWTRQRLRMPEWIAAISVSSGLALFLVVGAPTGGAVNAPLQEWGEVMGSVAALSIGMLLLGRRVDRRARAALFASSAGVVFGLQDALTKSALGSSSLHPLSLVTTWQPYVVVLCALYGLLLAQDAYKSAPLPVTLPPLTILEPVAGVVIGAAAFEEHLRTSGLAPLWEAVGIVAMVVGGVALARCPVVVGQARQCRVSGLGLDGSGRPRSHDAQHRPDLR